MTPQTRSAAVIFPGEVWKKKMESDLTWAAETSVVFIIDGLVEKQKQKVPFGEKKKNSRQRSFFCAKLRKLNILGWCSWIQILRAQGALFLSLYKKRRFGYEIF